MVERGAASPDRSPDRAGERDETARLSPNSLAPRNRITEYENALTQSAKKRSEGPIFEVIKKSRKPDDKSSPIANLPNGKVAAHQAHI
jgi:hypothetical protein